MHYQTKILSLFLFFIIYPFFAQFKPSKNYTTADGLPNNAVRSLFLDKNDDLWIGTENGVSRFLNGTFQNIFESDGLGHNSCWDITQDINGNMWFASYGGGVSKFDGDKFNVFTVKNGLPANKTRKVFPYKNKVYVGTEQGISIIDINTNNVVTPKVPSHKEDFISLSFFVYENEVYFTTVHNGLYKVDQSNIVPQIIPVVSNQKAYSLGLFGTTLYSSNEGFIEKYDIAKIKKGDTSSIKFGQSMVWQYTKDKRNTIYAAAWGVYTPDGGLYRIEKDKMIPIANYFGVDSKVLLNVVYDKSNDILYVGSNDKGVYAIRLDEMITYHAFENKSIIDFTFSGSQKMVLHNKGISILNATNKVLRTVSLTDFKKVEADFLLKNKNKNKIATQYRESRDFELNFNIPTNEIEFYEIVKHQNSFWVSSNIGIFEMSGHGEIIAYIPKHSLKIGFTANHKFIETITYAGVYLYDNVYQLKGRHYSKFEKRTPQYIVKILNNNNKTYLLSVFNGLYVYKNNEFHSYLAEGIWKENKFKHITVNSKGQLILSAEFGDVFIIEDSKNFEILKTISKKEIIGNTIQFLEAYKDYILIGTEKGINIYKNGKLQLVDKQLGLNDCAITTSQIFENQLWLGTKKGFYTIDLNKLTADKKTVSNIEIKGISINAEPIKSSNYNWFAYTSKKIVCDYQHNTIAIDFMQKAILLLIN
ncbi:ligand-binding sensor domain-containing protein [Flavobacterium sp. TSSA_36]|uniref:ligand-binding sensor domain-containing protein n=1 Tax=Flavobacterium sp. TSSA_36 TaxID=3447669 RepID=UPI003F41A905